MSENWKHCITHIDRSGKSKVFLGGLPYTTWLDKLLYRWRYWRWRYQLYAEYRRTEKRFKRECRARQKAGLPEPLPTTFHSSEWFKSENGSLKDFTDDFVFEMVFKRKGKKEPE